MSGLAEEIRDAEAKVARLKALAEAATCAEMGRHDWQHIGGRNAGCSDECCCSVPVYQCSRCKDCDYGDNSEAVEVRAECAKDAEFEDARMERVTEARRTLSDPTAGTEKAGADGEGRDA